MKKFVIIPFLVFTFVLPLAAQTVHKDFTLSRYQSSIPGARALIIADDGTFYVSSNRGSVYRISPDNKLTTVAEGLNNPIGITLYKDDLFVSSVDRIYRIKNISTVTTSLKPEEMTLFYSGLPADRSHGGRYIRAFGDTLIVAIGVPFNTGVVVDPYGTLVAMDLTEETVSSYRIIARGLRNSVGFDEKPGVAWDQGGLYMSDNGQDELGDDFPPDEINRLSAPGEHFGFPYFAERREITAFRRPGNLIINPPTPPVFNLDAHGAALGIYFYRGTDIGRYKDALLVAQHGSWARKSARSGYRVLALLSDGSTGFSEKEVLVDFLGENDKVMGRPVDVRTDKNGVIYFTDDRNGCVWKLTPKTAAQ
jgi:glucose/arabinose dehydrogenase